MKSKWSWSLNKFPLKEIWKSMLSIRIWVSAYGDGVSMLSTILKWIYDNIKTNDNLISR